MSSFTAGRVAGGIQAWKRREIHCNFPGEGIADLSNMSAPLPPVLVVDDEKNMRLSLQTVLKDEGYAARAVESAEEALELLAREEFFMVITDARLGGMSGYEFLGKTPQPLAGLARPHAHGLCHAQARG